ncbi:hypothetical protein AXW83_23560 [Bosea sp. PAMC 26642]|nr:hypothetical protein AXW83_23560 [Bosea sp. PAMC 26642]
MLYGVSVLAMAAATGGEVAAQALTTPAGAQQVRSYRFDIPTKPLLAALADFTATTRIQIVRPSGEALSGRSGAVSGTLPAADALARLLAGTGLTYRFTSAGTVTVARAGGEAAAFAQAGGAITLDTIDVQGINPNAVVGQPPAPYAGEQVGSGTRVGLLGNRSVFDTPFNVTGYTEKSIEDQQARSLADVVASDPSVRSILPPNQKRSIREP